NRLVVTMPGKILHFDLPLRPGKLIAALSRLAGEITLPPVIALGTYTLLPHDFILQEPDGEEIKLTEKEISILLFLYNNQAQAPISRQALLDGVWAYADGVETHTLETHIYRLRQ